jgi:hypothetical protein
LLRATIFNAAIMAAFGEERLDSRSVEETLTLG